MSRHTLAAYRHDLLALLKFCERREVQRFAALNNFQVRALQRRNMPAASRRAAFNGACLLCVRSTNT